LWLAMRRHQRQDGAGKMAAVADALGDRCRIWLARVEGRTAAAMMVFTGTNAYDFRAAMDESLRGFRANDLLLRLATEQACRDGSSSRFDLYRGAVVPTFTDVATSPSPSRQPPTAPSPRAKWAGLRRSLRGRRAWSILRQVARGELSPPVAGTRVKRPASFSVLPVHPSRCWSRNAAFGKPSWVSTSSVSAPCGRSSTLTRVSGDSTPSQAQVKTRR